MRESFSSELANLGRPETQLDLKSALGSLREVIEPRHNIICFSGELTPLILCILGRLEPNALATSLKKTIRQVDPFAKVRAYVTAGLDERLGVHGFDFLWQPLNFIINRSPPSRQYAQPVMPPLDLSKFASLRCFACLGRAASLIQYPLGGVVHAVRPICLRKGQLGFFSDRM